MQSHGAMCFVWGTAFVLVSLKKLQGLTIIFHRICSGCVNSNLLVSSTWPEQASGVLTYSLKYTLYDVQRHQGTSKIMWEHLAGRLWGETLIACSSLAKQDCKWVELYVMFFWFFARWVNLSTASCVISWSRHFGVFQWLCCISKKQAWVTVITRTFQVCI